MSGGAFAGGTGAPVDIAAIFGARTHYAVLGLTPSATAAEIRHAYRQVSLRIHPDKVQALSSGSPELLKDAEAAFKLVASAYETLSDESKRATYDYSAGLRKKTPVTGARSKPPATAKEQPEPWVYQPPEKEPSEPEVRETISLSVTHAVFGHEVRLQVSKGVDAALVKRTLSKMVKRGPPDRIELSTATGVSLSNDHVFERSEELYSVGLSLGPPRHVKVAVTDSRTGVCRNLKVVDTASILQVAREVATIAGVAILDVEMGMMVLSQEGLWSFERVDERELLNGRRQLATQGKASGLLFLTEDEAAAMQDDLIAVYSAEDVQIQLRMLIAQQSTARALDLTSLSKAASDILSKARKDVVAKWGFDGEDGFLQMCTGIHRYESVDRIHIRSLKLEELLQDFTSYSLVYKGADAVRSSSSATAAGGRETTESAEASSKPAEGRSAETAKVAEGGSSGAGAQKEQAQPAPAPVEQQELEGDGNHGQIWKIVGGQDKGGILVREGLALDSFYCEKRLSTGAYVRELQLIEVEGVGERLNFERVTGTGPARGWISVTLPHKRLATRVWMTESEVQQLRKGSYAHPGQHWQSP